MRENSRKWALSNQPLNFATHSILVCLLFAIRCMRVLINTCVLIKLYNIQIVLFNYSLLCLHLPSRQRVCMMRGFNCALNIIQDIWLLKWNDGGGKDGSSKLTLIHTNAHAKKHMKQHIGNTKQQRTAQNSTTTKNTNRLSDDEKIIKRSCTAM